MATKPAANSTTDTTQQQPAASAKTPRARSAQPAATIQAAKKPAAKPPAKRKAAANAASAPATVLTITDRAIGAEVGTPLGMTKNQITGFLAGQAAAMSKHLIAGERVRVIGIGTLRSKDMPERPGRNPQTGEAIIIKASKRVSFSAAKELQDHLA